MSIFLYADMAIRATIAFTAISFTPGIKNLPMTTKLGLSVLSYPLSFMLGFSMSAKDYKNSSIPSIFGGAINGISNVLSGASNVCDSLPICPSLKYGATTAVSSSYNAAYYVANSTLNLSIKSVLPYNDRWLNAEHLLTKFAPAAAIIGGEYLLLKDALNYKKQLGIYGVQSTFAYGAANLSIAACAVPMATACLLPFGAAAGVAAISFGVHAISDMVTTAYVNAAKTEQARARD